MEKIDDWLLWRHKGIGGSDVPVIYGLSDYKNYHQLIQEKINWKDNLVNTTSYIAERGHKWESKIRDMLYLQTLKKYEPLLLVNEEFPYMRVSLDGHCPETKEIIEMKLTGKKKFQLMKDGICPKNFMYQVQYQLAVTGYKFATVWAVLYEREWSDEKQKLVEKTGREIHSLKVEPDLKLQKEIIIKVSDVWQKIQKARKSMGVELESI